MKIGVQMFTVRDYCKNAEDIHALEVNIGQDFRYHYSQIILASVNIS